MNVNQSVFMFIDDQLFVFSLSTRCIVLFDQGFDVSTGIYSTGMRNGLQIVTNNRELVLKSWTRRKAKEWVSHLKAVANNQARDFTCPNPHNVSVFVLLYFRSILTAFKIRH